MGELTFRLAIATLLLCAAGAFVVAVAASWILFHLPMCSVAI